MSGADEPGLLATVVGQRGDLSGVKALLAEGGIVERPVVDLRASARRHGLRAGQVRRLLAVRELARRWHIPADSAAPAITSPREALLQFQDLRASPKECFAVLYLNTRNQPVGCEKVAVGGLNVAALQPREVFGPALTFGAAAVILAHNHPSGDPTPSADDVKVTRDIAAGGKLLDVELLDHLVVARSGYVSLKQRGLGFG